jgi:hypothetical protein
MGSVIKGIGDAIGGAVKAVSNVVSGIAKTVGNIAGAVGDFVNKSPIGKFLQALPGIGSVVSMIGKGADIVKGVAGAVENVAGFASRLGETIAGIGNDASAALSGGPLGFIGSALQGFNSLDGIVGLSKGLSSMFSDEVDRTPAQQDVSDFGKWNIAQMMAKRQAELTDLLSL